MSTEVKEMHTNNPQPLEQRVTDLELRVAKIEDPMHTVLENVLHLRREMDEQRRLLLKIAEHLGIDSDSFAV